MTLAWDANPEPDLAGYRLTYYEQRWFHEVSLVTTNTSVTFTNIPFGIWTFELRAFNQTGTESPPSTLSWTNLPVYSVKVQQALSLSGPWDTYTNLGSFMMDLPEQATFYRVRVDQQ